MKSRALNGITLYYDANEQQAADIIAQASEKTVRLLHEHWGLETPKECIVYVMTSINDIMRVAPWNWRILLIIFYPLWYYRAKKVWPYTGGWEQQFGKRHTAGIKTPELMAASDRSIGEQIFIPEMIMNQKVALVTCHELTHAHVSHLKLPNWLKEGTAMLAVDYYAGQVTIKPDTLQSLKAKNRDIDAGRGRSTKVKDWDRFVYQYVRGYWITRYLNENQPDLVRRLLSREFEADGLDNEIADTLQIDREQFWDRIDNIVVEYFTGSIIM